MGCASSSVDSPAQFRFIATEIKATARHIFNIVGIIMKRFCMQDHYKSQPMCLEMRYAYPTELYRLCGIRKSGSFELKMSGVFSMPYRMFSYDIPPSKTRQVDRKTLRWYLEILTITKDLPTWNVYDMWI